MTTKNALKTLTVFSLVLACLLVIACSSTPSTPAASGPSSVAPTDPAISFESRGSESNGPTRGIRSTSQGGEDGPANPGVYATPTEAPAVPDVPAIVVPPAPTTLPSPTVAPTVAATVAQAPREEPVQPVTTFTNYTVRYGDTLAQIAARMGVTQSQIVRLNGLSNPNHLEIGQVLHVSQTVQPGRAPADKIIPDSEAVNSPAYADFDVNAFASKYGGYLARYRETVEGMDLSGPQVVQLVADRFSVGPRVLLTILEMEGGWVTGSPATNNELYYPMGYYMNGWTGLYRQLWFAADKLNEGYYAKVYKTFGNFTLLDGKKLAFSANTNPGTASLQDFFAYESNYATWQQALGPNGFAATYKKLFGDPFARAIEPLVPADLKQPQLRLPWEDGHTWFYVGGPHGGWADGSAWAAVDFAPTQGGGTCTPSTEWTVAVAPGRVVQNETGRLFVNMAGTNFAGNGWTIMYMHQASRPPIGTVVQTGDDLGHPSCQGGVAQADHLHIARLYNGQWIAAADRRIPFVLGGWQVGGEANPYDGTISHGMEEIEACNCREVDLNGITAVQQIADNGPDNQPAPGTLPASATDNAGLTLPASGNQTNP